MKKTKEQRAISLGTLIVRRLSAVRKKVDAYPAAEIKDITRQVRELEHCIEKAHKYWDKALIRAEISEDIARKTIQNTSEVFKLLKGQETAGDVQKILKRTMALHTDLVYAYRAEKPKKTVNNGGDKPVTAIKLGKVRKARRKLKKYLKEFPEHDQGDLRVFEAFELLEKFLNK